MCLVQVLDRVWGLIVGTRHRSAWYQNSGASDWFSQVSFGHGSGERRDSSTCLLSFDCAHLCLTLHLVGPLCKLEIGHDGHMYSGETGRCCKSDVNPVPATPSHSQLASWKWRQWEVDMGCLLVFNPLQLEEAKTFKSVFLVHIWGNLLKAGWVG
jgi:hypothetical protein